MVYYNKPYRLLVIFVATLSALHTVWRCHALYVLFPQHKAYTLELNAKTLLIIILVGEVTERPKVQHWKCCVRVKPRTAGSNPALSAKKL